MASDDERAKLDAMTKALGAYQQAQAKVLALGKDKKQQDAADISDGLASMAFDESLAALTALTQFNFEGGRAAAAQAGGVYQQARLFVLVVLGVALLLGVALALLITRQLLRQLGGEPATAVAVARAVAEGDLGTPHPLRAGDSTSLLAWLQTMQQSLAQAVANVRQGSDHVATASAQIASGNQDLSAAPNSRPARCSRPRRRWTSWARPCTTTPTTRGRRASSPKAPRRWRRAVVRSSARSSRR